MDEDAGGRRGGVRERAQQAWAAVTAALDGPGATWPRRVVAALVVCVALLGALLVVPPAGLAGPALLLAPVPPGLADADGIPEASVLTDAEGRPFARLYDQYRRPVDGAEIAEPLKAAVLAIEDRRFLDHDGVDVPGVLRAMVDNTLRSGNPFSGQGASTITMQYVKNLRLYTAADADEEQAATAATLARKVLDVRAALAVEQELPKPEILERYLNTVYFGNGAYGIAAAARTYFDTEPAHLTLAQSALLAGMIRAPGRFDPLDRPEAATARRDLVLAAMVETGAATPEQAAAARTEPLGVVQPLRQAAPGCEGADPGTGFFCRYVLDVLARNGLNLATLRTGGYTIRTTLDRAASDAATRAATEQAPPAESPGVANAVAVVEPGDARRVRALAANHVLGPDAEAGQTAYALPTAPVPFGAGSTFKVFTAAAAMERGIGLRDQLPAPERYTSREFRNGGEPYTVTGANGAPPTVSLQDALALSPNTAFVALLDEIGSVDPVVEMARRLGMRESLSVPAGPGSDKTMGEAVSAEERASFTLGPVPAMPLELANVAATIASRGRWCPPTAVESVTDAAGGPVPIERAPCEQAVPEGLADTLAVGMSQSAQRGTAAAAARAEGWTRPVLAKTGTTQDSLSAGFLAATPQLAGAVVTWADASPPRPVCGSGPPRLCNSGSLSGGGTPARTWFAAMEPLHEGLDVVALPRPDPRYLGAPPPPPPPPPAEDRGDESDSGDSGDESDEGSDDGGEDEDS